MKNTKITHSVRKSIEDIINYGEKEDTKIIQQDIADMLNISRYTLIKEMARCKGKYSADEAQLHFEEEQRAKLEKALEENRRG